MKVQAFFVGMASFLFCSLAGAEGDAANFDKRKAEAVSEIDERIQKLQEMKGCIGNASNHEAIKTCRSHMKEWRQEEHAERLEKRKARIEERMKKLQEKKNEQ